MLRRARQDRIAVGSPPRVALGRHAMAWQVRRWSGGLSIAMMACVVAAGVVLPSQTAPPARFDGRVGDIAAADLPKPAFTLLAVRSTPTALTSGDLALRPVAQASGTALTPPVPASPSLAAGASSEVQAARELCARMLAGLTLEWEAVPAVNDGSCTVAAPLRVRRIGASGVELSPPALMNCPLAAALHSWVDNILQPVARELLATSVVQLSGVQGYSCRNRNNAKSGPVSEHAFANAIDISALHLADGRALAVVRDWGPVARDAGKPAAVGAGKADAVVSKAGISVATGSASPAAQVLRRIHAGACTTFGTVLGPDANDAHRDHLHFDLKVRGHKALCE